MEPLADALITEGGLLGILLVGSVLVNWRLFQALQALHRETREADRENLKEMFRAIKLLGDVERRIGRGE